MQEEPWYNPIVVFLSGMNVPLGSSERMHQEVQLPHEEVVRGLEAFQNEIVAVTTGTSSGANGAWPEEYVRAMATFASGDGADYVQGLKDTAGQLADSAHEFGYQIDYTNAMIVGQVVVFLAEWALTLVLAYFNPIQALLEQLALERVFGQFFKMALVRFAINAGLIISVSVGLAAALDGLTRWVLAQHGETTTQGSQYRKQSLQFGAIQGAFGALLPFMMEPAAKLLSKAFSPAVSKAIREAIDTAVADPGNVLARDLGKDLGDDLDKLLARDLGKDHGGDPDKLLARDLGKDHGGDPGKHFGGRAGKRFESGVAREADEKPGPPPLAAFSRRFADDVTGMAGALHTGVVDVQARRVFTSGMGGLFAQAFGEGARAAGESWAAAFMKNAGRAGLQKALYGALEKLPAEVAGDRLRLALSKGVVRGLDTQWQEKLARMLAVEAPINAGHQNVSEGFFNLLETGRFTTSFATGISGAGGGIISGVLHAHAVHLANTLKTSPLGTPPPLDINPSQVNSDTLVTHTSNTTDTGGAGSTGPYAGPYPPRHDDAEKWTDSTDTPVELESGPFRGDIPPVSGQEQERPTPQLPSPLTTLGKPDARPPVNKVTPAGPPPTTTDVTGTTGAKGAKGAGGRTSPVRTVSNDVRNPPAGRGGRPEPGTVPNAGTGQDGEQGVAPETAERSGREPNGAGRTTTTPPASHEQVATALPTTSQDLETRADLHDTHADKTAADNADTLVGPERETADGDRATATSGPVVSDARHGPQVEPGETDGIAGPLAERGNGALVSTSASRTPAMANDVLVVRAGALESFRRLWSTSSEEATPDHPVHAALRRAYDLVRRYQQVPPGGISGRLDQHREDFNRLSPADQDTVLLAYRILEQPSNDPVVRMVHDAASGRMPQVLSGLVVDELAAGDVGRLGGLLAGHAPGDRASISGTPTSAGNVEPVESVSNNRGLIPDAPSTTESLPGPGGIDPRLTDRLPAGTGTLPAARVFAALTEQFAGPDGMADRTALGVVTENAQTSQALADAVAVALTGRTAHTRESLTAIVDEVADNAYARWAVPGSSDRGGSAAGLLDRLRLTADRAAALALCVTVLRDLISALSARTSALSAERIPIPGIHALDDSQTGLGDPRTLLAPVPAWTRINHPEDATVTLEPDETAVVVWHRSEGPGRAIAARRTTTGDILWIHPEAPQEQRVTTTPPAWDAVDAHALIIGTDGRLRPDALPRHSQAESTAAALTHPPTDHRYGTPLKSLVSKKKKHVPTPVSHTTATPAHPAPTSGALSPRHAALLSASTVRRLPDGSVTRNWTGEPIPPEMVFSHVYALRGNENNVLQKALWKLPAMLVRTTLHGETVWLPGAGEADRALPFGEFADLLANDPELAKDMPIVLWADLRGKPDLPRAIAIRTGHDVWSYTGKLVIGEKPALPSLHLANAPQPGEPIGQWMLSRPDGPGPIRPEQLGRVAYSSFGKTHTVGDSEIITHTLVDLHGRPFGRAAFRPGEWTGGREIKSSHLPDFKTARPVEMSGKSAGEPLPLPWAGQEPKPYFFHSHGTFGIIALPVAEASNPFVVKETAEVSGRELGQWLRRRPSLSALPAPTPIVLYACQSASVAQEVANTTGRTVYAATTTIGDKVDKIGVRVTAFYSQIFTASPGVPGQWLTFHPE